MKKLLGLFAVIGVMLAAGAASAADKVVFGTNWLAQGGHGGFYQAVADGTYEKYGLDVEIRMGGPQVNTRPMLAAGRLDFLMGGNLLLAFDNVRNDIPTTVVAAIFQKDPQAMMAHKGRYKDFAALTEAPEILISKDGQFSLWKWMVESHGFRDEQLRPYGYNMAQFLTNPAAVQQAYGTAEPLYAAAEGVETDVFLLADHGWSTYGSIIETRNDLLESNPDLVQRFIDASIEGWNNFLYGDRTVAYQAIIAANPEMTVEKLDAEMQQFEKLAIIDTGDTIEKGIGAMDEARVRGFHDLAVEAKIIDAGSVDLSRVADFRFVNQGKGLDIKSRLTGQ